MSSRLETQCIHGNLDFSYEEATRAVSFPIYQTVTFGHIGLGHSSGFDYTREKNPTRQRIEELCGACVAVFGVGDYAVEQWRLRQDGCGGCSTRTDAEETP